MSRAEDQARAALEQIDAAREQMREARNKAAECESVINLAMAKLHAYFAMKEGTR